MSSTPRPYRTLRCSSLPRLKQCPASAVPTASPVGTASSPEAELGTAVHEVLARWVRGGVDREEDCEDAAQRHGADPAEVSALAAAGWSLWCREFASFFPNPRVEEELAAYRPLPATNEVLRLTGHPDVYSLVGGLSVRVLDWKCLCAEQEVQMADGTSRQAKNIADGDMVLAWGPDGATAAAAFPRDNGTHPIWTVRTRCGRYVRCTAEHPFLTKRGWVQAKDLVRGDRLRVATDWSPPNAEGAARQARFLGLMVADGNFTTGHNRWSKSDPALVEWVRTYAAERGAELVLESREGNWRLNYAKKLPELEPLVGHRAKDKFVPDSVLTSGPDAWAAFLAGYFDGDGHLRSEDTGPYPCLHWDSVSRRLLRQCQQMLAYLGVRSSLWQCETTYKDEPYTAWRLNVRDRESVRRAARLLVCHSEKAKRLPEYADLAVGTAEREWDKVAEVTEGPPGPSIALTVPGPNTHVTGGLVTHNTGWARDDYEEQLRGYCWLALQECPEATSAYGCVLFVRHRAAEARQYTREELADWWHGLAAGQADPVYRPGEWCGRCPRALECPARARQLTLSTRALLGERFEYTALPETERRYALVQLHRHLGEVKALAEITDAFLRSEVEVRGGAVRAGDKELRLTEQKRTAINPKAGWPVLADAIGTGALYECLTVSKAAAEAAVKALAPRGQKAEAVQALSVALEAAGALEVTTAKRLELKTVTPLLESSNGDDSDAEAGQRPDGDTGAARRGPAAGEGAGGDE